MIDEEARKLMQNEVLKKVVDNSPVMQIIRQDGSTTEVENPFGAMIATYDTLRADPNAIPELSDESREMILKEIAMGTAPKNELIPDQVVEEAEKDHERSAGRFLNRHERRRLVALARQKKLEGGER